jgi:colanic acid biosynthesis glycosyl transferase WcaI
VHILVLNQYYPPDTSATAKMAAQVVERLAVEHRVTVLAGRPSYDPDERYPARLLRRDVQGNVTIERVGSSTYSRHRMAGRVSNYLSYLSLAVPRALTIRPDVILAMTDPPVAGIAAALVAKLSGRPLVYNIRDLYPDMALGGSIVRPSRLVRLWEQLHRRTLRRAAKIIVLGEDMRERILSKGIVAEKIAVVRDGTSLPEKLASADHPVAQEIRGGFPFAVIHAGNLGFYGAWDTLIRAAQILGDDGVGFVFIGDGAERSRIEALANGCPQVRFMPFRPAGQIPFVMAAGDLHIVTVKRGLEGVVVPSKLYSILAAGRPVLAVAPESCEVVRIVRQSGCGIVADPDDPESVARALREIHCDRARLEFMGRRAREIAKNYVRANELDRFTEVVEQAASYNRKQGGAFWPREKALAAAATSSIKSRIVEPLIEQEVQHSRNTEPHGG